MEWIEKLVKMKVVILFVIFFAGFLTFLQAQEERRFIRKGTELYNEGKFLEAGNEYWQAIDKEKDSFEGRFNVAATLFKQEKFEDAINQLQALENQTADKEKLSKIQHNIGNSYLGLKDLDKGIDAYKKALKNNPLDDETRYNLIAAMKMKQQEDEKKQDQDKEQQKDQDKQDQEEKQDKQDEQDKEQQQQQQQEGISRENAERILLAMDQDEKELQEKMNKKKEAQPVRIDKNW